jgi:arylsulfotransferase ASST
LAQVLPKESSELNYRLIGFSFPDVESASGYHLNIALGNYNSNDSFNEHIIRSIDSKVKSIIVEVPFFGVDYSWCISTVNAREKNNEFHHFSVGSIPELDTNLLRLKILTPATQNYKDAFVFLDAAKIMYDLNGNPIWYLPNITGPSSEPRDIKISDWGTITCVIDVKYAFELNYDGRILWKGPNNGTVSGDTVEGYHHEFTRLRNGHYMVLGNEAISWRYDHLLKNDSMLPEPNSDMKRGGDNDSAYNRIIFGTVIEYNEKGNVTWSWKSSNYFIGSDIKYGNRKTQSRKREMKKEKNKVIDVHENAFYFDEKDSVLYVGFRDIGRILKIKYPDGYVMKAYGVTFNPDGSTSGNDLFCGQHAITMTGKGDLLIYNNNSCAQDTIPELLMFRESGDGSDLKKIWEFKCPVDITRGNLRPAKMGKNGIVVSHDLSVGGNVIELPDQSIFVSMSSPYGNLFIVNTDKTILWHAVAERWNPGEKKWVESPQYRASIITDRKELDRLIWNSEQTK